jgi:hypothetical protein
LELLQLESEHEIQENHGLNAGWWVTQTLFEEAWADGRILSNQSLLVGM